MLDENKPELKLSVHKAIQTFYGLIGRTFMESIPLTKIQMVNEIVSGL